MSTIQLSMYIHTVNNMYIHIFVIAFAFHIFHFIAISPFKKIISCNLKMTIPLSLLSMSLITFNPILFCFVLLFVFSLCGFPFCNSWISLPFLLYALTLHFSAFKSSHQLLFNLPYFFLSCFSFRKSMRSFTFLQL